MDELEGFRMLHTHGDDDKHLVQLGYKPRLERSLGVWHAFSVSYGWVAILTGISALFFLGYSTGGPAFFWVYPIVGLITTLIALNLAEMAAQVPVEGSMYQGCKHLTGSRFIPWLTGWFLIAAMLVTVSVVGPTWQQVLTSVFHRLQFVGGPDDIGTSVTPSGAINAIILGGIALVLQMMINIVGVRLMARVAAVVVTIEIIAVFAVVIGLAVHVHRGPGVVFETNGLGAHDKFGYLGAFLVAGIAAAYVFFGFENAAMVAEETKDARRAGPTALLRALVVSLAMGIVLVLLALMSAKDLQAPQLSTTGFPYVIQSVLGGTFGDIVLIAIAIAVFGAGTAIMATGVRIIFAMARDGALPFSRTLAHVSTRHHTPVVPTILVTVVGLGLLGVNYGNPRIFGTIAAVVILLFYITYLFVMVPMLVARLRGRWPVEQRHGYFSLGRYGLASNLLAVIGCAAVVVDVAWPRAAIYGNDHWYLQYGAFVVVGLLLVTGVTYYWFKQRESSFGVVVDEHRPDESDLVPERADPPASARSPKLSPTGDVDLGAAAVRASEAQA
jgi:urea carboxylase system permease